MVLWSGMIRRVLELAQSTGFMMIANEKAIQHQHCQTRKLLKFNNQHIHGDKISINNQQDQLQQGHDKFGWIE